MSEALEIRFPEDQQEGTKAVMSRWLKQAGDPVTAFEPVAEIETDKVVVEVAAPADGVIREILKQAGEDTAPGDVLCTLNAADQAPAAEAPSADEPEAPAAAPAAETVPDQGGPSAGKASGKLSPAVRHRLMKYGLRASDISGSGRDGRITVADVETHFAAHSETRDDRSNRIQPHDNMRRQIADHMVTSLLHTAPHVTSVFEADMSAVLKHRAAHKADFANNGIALTLTAYFVAACVQAIRAVPEVNSRWFDEHLEIFPHMNIGIGTALEDKGLIVPVLQNAQDLGLRDIAAGLTDLTGRAREGKLSPADVRGGTFTISNHGTSGSLIATPIVINQPQSAILGVGKMEKRVKVREVDGEDTIAIRPMCYVSLTIDHRVLDGFQTNAFLSAVVEHLQSWSENDSV